MPTADSQEPELTSAAMSERTRQALQRAAQEALDAQGRRGRPGHPETDRRTLELTTIAVERIDRDPALLQAGLANIGRWTRRNGGYLPPYHAEWKALIEERPWPELRTLLLQNTDEGQRLRSNHPFIGPPFVTEEERTAIYAA